MSANVSYEERMQHRLQQRKEKGLLRKLRTFPAHYADFSSNDYLGFSHSGLLNKKVQQFLLKHENGMSGSSGSRLLAGNTEFAEELERKIAAFHHSENALIFNSGYDANLGLLSCVAQHGDAIIYDELVHASIHDGMRLSRATTRKFLHNNVSDLEVKIQRLPTYVQNIYVVVESLYSMDGDFAPLEQLVRVCEAFNCRLIVDEAHSTGVYGEEGRGLCFEKGIHEKCFARVFTFGKALGTHGAAVCGSNLLRDYLINFSRPFIFSTALPYHSLAAIECAYDLLKGNSEREKLQENIQYFRKTFRGMPGYNYSSSPIQIIIVPGNDEVQRVADSLTNKELDVRAVKSPTVKEGSERLRISLHAHNTQDEINRLFLAISSR
jgi:8-amino-7-oxononanoate synthase